MPVIITGKSPYDRSGELLSQGFAQGFGMAMEAGRLALVKRQRQEREDAERQRQQTLRTLQAAIGDDDVVTAYYTAHGNPVAADMYTNMEEGPEKRMIRSRTMEMAIAEKDADELQGTLARIQVAEQQGIMPPGSAQLAMQGIQTGGVTKGELEDDYYNSLRRKMKQQAEFNGVTQMLAALDQKMALAGKGVGDKPEDLLLQESRMAIQGMLDVEAQMPPGQSNLGPIYRKIAEIEAELLSPEAKQIVLDSAIQGTLGGAPYDIVEGLNERIERNQEARAFREPTPEADRALPTDEMPGEFTPAGSGPPPEAAPTREDKSEPRAETKLKEPKPLSWWRRTNMAVLERNMVDLSQRIQAWRDDPANASASAEDFKSWLVSEAKAMGMLGSFEKIAESLKLRPPKSGFELMVNEGR